MVSTMLTGLWYSNRVGVCASLLRVLGKRMGEILNMRGILWSDPEVASTPVEN